MIKYHKFPSLFAAEHALNGGVSASLNLAQANTGLPEKGPGFYDLVGKTLIFLAPAVTVTFVAGVTPGFLHVNEVLAQIRAAVAGTVVTLQEGGRLHIVLASGATAISVGSTGTANSILGFSPAANTTGKVYGSDPTTPPALLNAYFSPVDVSHIAVTVE